SPCCAHCGWLQVYWPFKTRLRRAHSRKRTGGGSASRSLVPGQRDNLLLAQLGLGREACKELGDRSSRPRSTSRSSEGTGLQDQANGLVAGREAQRCQPSKERATGASAATAHVRGPTMRHLALILSALASGCTHELTADAVLLVESTDDLEIADGSLENIRPHIGVSVTVTTDAKVFHSWGTDEKWRVITTNGGEHIDGGVLCRRNQT